MSKICFSQSILFGAGLNIYSISGTGHRTVQLPGDLKDQDFAVGSVAHFKDGQMPLSTRNSFKVTEVSESTSFQESRNS